jgi:hypothetical protein
MMPDQMQKWLRQPDGTSVSILVENMSRNFFFRFVCRMFYVLYPFVTYLLTFPRLWKLSEYSEDVLFESIQYAVVEPNGTAEDFQTKCVKSPFLLVCVPPLWLRKRVNEEGKICQYPFQSYLYSSSCVCHCCVNMSVDHNNFVLLIITARLKL